MQKLQLELELEQVNLVLTALGKLPFTDVYALIEKIRQQAASQLENQGVSGKHVTEHGNENS